MLLLFPLRFRGRRGEVEGIRISASLHPCLVQDLKRTDGTLHGAHLLAQSYPNLRRQRAKAAGDDREARWSPSTIVIPQVCPVLLLRLGPSKFLVGKDRVYTFRASQEKATRSFLSKLRTHISLPSEATSSDHHSAPLPPAS